MRDIWNDHQNTEMEFRNARTTSERAFHQAAVATFLSPKKILTVSRLGSKGEEEKARTSQHGDLEDVFSWRRRKRAMEAQDVCLTILFFTTEKRWSWKCKWYTFPLAHKNHLRWSAESFPGKEKKKSFALSRSHSKVFSFQFNAIHQTQFKKPQRDLENSNCCSSTMARNWVATSFVDSRGETKLEGFCVSKHARNFFPTATFLNASEEISFHEKSNYRRVLRNFF